MALITFQLWRRTVPCPISNLETFNGMTTACDKTFWSRIQVTYHHENKTTISDIPLHFHHIKKIISICVFKSFCLNSALFHTFGPRSDSFFNFFGHRSNQTLFIIFSSYDRQMCLLHTDSHLQTDMIMTIDHVSCHYSCHYHHCV